VFTARYELGLSVKRYALLSEKNSDVCHLYHKLIGFSNPDEKCLLRGKNWFFK
jgi:hypothetical protein